jgi:hypothetical protein
LTRLQRVGLHPQTLKRGLCLFLVLLPLAALSGLPMHTYTLRVQEANEGRELAAIPVSQGDLLQVEYVHSMYKVKQGEYFHIGPDLRFYLEKVTFGSYAAAVYYDAEPVQGLAFEDGLWMVKGMGKNYSVLKYRISPGTGHVLNIGDQRLDLSGKSQSPGGRIEICLEKKRKN